MKVCRMCLHKLTGKDWIGQNKEMDNCDKCGKLERIVYNKPCKLCNDTKLTKGLSTTLLIQLDSLLGTNLKEKKKCPCPLEI